MNHDAYSPDGAGGIMLVAERIIGKCMYLDHPILGYLLRKIQTGIGKMAPIRKPERSGQYTNLRPNISSGSEEKTKKGLVPFVLLVSL